MDKNTPHYDYIIVGAGAAGLMLADAMGQDPYFATNTILLLEKDVKDTNNRTWCFWEKDSGSFEPIVHKSWDRIYFGGKNFDINPDITPYKYKMVRGIDFYESHLKRIENYSNISRFRETVIDVKDYGKTAQVTTLDKTYTATKVFSSLFDFKILLEQSKYPVLQQHFVGWFIKTNRKVFDPSTATFMDFAIPQNGNTRFMYVLPFSENEALVEYTLFSEALLKTDEYEKAIGDYLKDKFQVEDFQIQEKEKGSIPMTCYRFQELNTANIIHIGTAGGWSKPSTGYTFLNTSRNIKKLIEHLKGKKNIGRIYSRNRFWYYDLLLLDILHADNGQGQRIFGSLFKRKAPQEIFKFLDEQTSFWEDLKIIAACPKKIFLKALIKRAF